jgi:prepilin-type N-terminal cleavage/methylation domain-containing protein
MKKAFTLIEILITSSIISLVMVGISALTGNQVNRLKEKITREEFISTYNEVLLNSIGSSNINKQ